jgi:polysaccharide export outer membrane protein
MKKSTLILIFIGIIFSSCSYKNKNILFKTDKEVKTNDAVFIINIDSLKAVSNYKHVIKVGDRVLIRFLNNYDIAQSSPAQGGSGGGQQTSEQGYLVNFDSTVTLPLIGRTNIVGKTRLEAASFLEKKYGQYINNPIIDVNIANLTATVLGEVSRQGLVPIDKEQTTLVELIALAGGILEGGRKDRIKIIRGNQVIHVNLKQIIALQSPDIIIHHNDIVYIEPYNIKARSEPILGSMGILQIVVAVIQLASISLQFYIISAQ